MRILPTLLLLTVLTAITMAITASTVSATISVTREPTSACGDAVLNGPHVVDGGCHVNFRSEGPVPMNAHIPGMGEILLNSCTIDIEAQLSADGEGWVKRATLGTTGPMCVRRVCDEANMTFRPWRLHIREVGPAGVAIVLTLCLRTIGESEGARGLDCTLQVPFGRPSTHRYEFSAAPAQRCAEVPIVSMTGHFTTPGPEHVEIVHAP